MVETGSGEGPDLKYAHKIDPKKLTMEQLEYIRQKKMAQWAKILGKMRSRNIITGLAIGGIVLGIYGYTFYSISQEKFLEELEEEAKVAEQDIQKHLPIK